MKNKSNRTMFLAALSCMLISTCPLAWAEDCVPEGMDEERAPVAMPDLFPASIPLPDGHNLISAAGGAADEYNPYAFATLEFLVPIGKEALFSYYEQALPAAGYRIVMWEKDEGATGFRVRGEGIDQASIAINEYDCQGYASISVSFLP